VDVVFFEKKYCIFVREEVVVGTIDYDLEASISE
jgi:hypothetical protein